MILGPFGTYFWLESTFYELGQWNTFVDNMLSSFTVPQPSFSRPPPTTDATTTAQPPMLPPQPASGQHQTSGSLQMDQGQVNEQQINHDIHITPASLAERNFLFFPHSVSQSTINQKMESNACTFIRLILNIFCVHYRFPQCSLWALCIMKHYEGKHNA